MHVNNLHLLACHELHWHAMNFHEGTHVQALLCAHVHTDLVRLSFSRFVVLSFFSYLFAMKLHHSVIRALLQLCLAVALLASCTEALEEQPGVRLFGVGIGVVLIAFFGTVSLLICCIGCTTARPW
jgi:hypothetical protein